MQPTLTTPTVPAVQIPIMLVAEVQDSLLVVVHDLTRLDGLLAHTMENLMERFTSASANLATPALMKIYYILAMYMGRLEFISVFALIGYGVGGIKKLCKNFILISRV